MPRSRDLTRDGHVTVAAFQLRIKLTN